MHNDRGRNTSGQGKSRKRKQKKKLNYKSLCPEIQRMRNMKCMIIPANIGATRIVTKVLHKTEEATSGKQQIDSLQKTAVGKYLPHFNASRPIRPLPS